MTVIQIDKIPKLGVALPKDDHIILMGRKCPLCDRQRTIRVERESLVEYAEGSLMREAFDYMDESIREELLTGLHPDTCQGEESAQAYVKAIGKLQERLTKVLSNA